MKKFKLYHGAWVNMVAPHLSERITSADAQKLLSDGGRLVRNTYNWDQSEPTSFWFVIKDEFGGIEELPTKVRNQVRKSLKTYDFKKVGVDEILEKGVNLYNLSRERFGDKELYVTKEHFEKYYCKGGQEFWLGIDKETGEAQCFAVNRCYDDYCSYLTMGVNPHAPSSSYPMYGLILEMNRYYLQEKGMKYVLDGARSITEHSNIQPFLEQKFKFRKAYSVLQIYYKPWLKFAVCILFPFRKWIRNKSVSAILRQEAWRRGL